MKTIIYAIGHRSSEPMRIRNLLLTVEWLNSISKVINKEINLIIAIIEQDSKPTLNGLFTAKNTNYLFVKNGGQYNRGWAFNVAFVEYPDADYYFFADNDIILSFQQDAKYIFKHCFEYDVVSPYGIVYDTDESLFDEQQPFYLQLFNDEKYIETLIEKQLLKKREHICLSGGIVGLSKVAMQKISGWDERFRGRGWEDYAMTAKINLCISKEKIHIYNTFAIHLWHPWENENVDRENNRRLNDEYSNYLIKHYLELIINTQKTIGCKYKYQTEQQTNKNNICKHCIAFDNIGKRMDLVNSIKNANLTYNNVLLTVTKYHSNNLVQVVYDTLCGQHYCLKDCKNGEISVSCSSDFTS
jgi:hypothetical protein